MQRREDNSVKVEEKKVEKKDVEMKEPEIKEPKKGEILALSRVL